MINIRASLMAITSVTLVAGCTPAEQDPQDAFIANLAEHCGNAYEGRVIKGDEEADATWMNSRIVIEVRECTEDRIRIPLHVGDNHSRTWVFTDTINGLQLKHDHRLEDGSHDPVTWYGGTSYTAGTATEQAFPADDFSKQMFSEQGLSVSIDNTWIVSFPTENTMVYRLLRENRDFQVEVDLSNPVEAPPAPWGWEDNYQYDFD
ncbi:MAG: hypothetical protein HLUCCO02_11190 [Idiomarinaceae bacterium HL-53]|nr:MAG: hypothetical protein HLUCCO02_11190 [Idiomarinaceae bacterium HL-53]CUS47634.1 hypothetical protein Ga0003345_0567 [Idiomarinaceae bacterium HL-53]